MLSFHLSPLELLRMPAELQLPESSSRIMARTQDQQPLPHVLLLPRLMLRLSLLLQATQPRLPSMPLLTLPSSITMLELILFVLLPLRPTLTPSSQVLLNQLRVRLLLLTWMLLRLILALIRTLPVAELLMLILLSITNKYYITLVTFVSSSSSYVVPNIFMA